MFPKGSIIRIIPPLFILACLLSACGIIPTSSEATVAVNESGTPVPTPTRDSSGYQAIPSQSCQVADWATTQSDKPQGDLIAWRPKTTDIAYMAPAERSSWYIGTLMLAKGPDFKQKNELAAAILAAGDLTWSPSGEQLAFLAFRPNENVYTVMTVKADGSGLTDLFPTDLARTDARTSQKSILGWQNENTLQVMASCGEECRQSYDINITTPPGPVLTPTPVVDYRELTNSLQINRNVQEFDAKQFPKILSDPNYNTIPNWSPDGQMIAYLDKKGLLWLLSIPQKVNYLLDIGLRNVDETQWSSDSHYLAIRAEDRIFLFQVPCGNAGK